MNAPSTDLVPYEAPSAPAFLLPLGDIAGAKNAIAQYEKLKTAIVVDSDKQIISGRTYLKKSFWRRVAFCFGLSLELVREERLLLDDGVTASKLAYRVTYRAVAPNGRSMDGDGMCVFGEKSGLTIEHNIRAIAHTRAKNRAISDLVGGGEVSAEEMPDDDMHSFTPARSPRATQTESHLPPTQFTLADCGEFAKDHDIPASMFRAATKKYAGKPDELMKAMMGYVRERDAEPEITLTVVEDRGADAADMAELPVGAKGN